MTYYFKLLNGEIYHINNYGSAMIFLEKNRFDIVETNFTYL